MKSADIDLSRRRILIVEDDYFIADELARSFQAYGAEVVGPAASIETALDLVGRNEAIELAVLDIDLRGRPVYPVADLLRRRGVSFVFATGYGAESVPDRYDQVPHLTKPADPTTIAVELGKLQRSRTASAPPADAQFRFRVRYHAVGWGWELCTPDGEVIASGTSGSSTAARANVFRAARSRHDN